MNSEQILELITKISKQYQDFLIDCKSTDGTSDTAKGIFENIVGFIYDLKYFGLITKNQLEKLSEFNASKYEFVSRFLSL